MCAGFQANLPWASCLENDQSPTINSSMLMEDWHCPDCYSKELNGQCHDQYGENYTFYNGECTYYQEYCMAHDFDAPFNVSNKCNETTTVADLIKVNAVSPPEDYLNGFMLGYTIPGSNGTKRSWDDYGSLSWELSLCLLLSWIVICLSMIKGLQSYGKVAYVVTLSPYVVLTALLAYCATLEGAKDGILYFITPDWESLKVCKCLRP